MLKTASICNNITYLNGDDDEDNTVFQTDEDRKNLEQEILDFQDESIEDPDPTQPLKSPFRPYWKN